jgi:diguanylate cyclase (GGDEF) domain
LGVAGNFRPEKREKIVGYLGIFSDITRRKENEDRIVHLAFHDALTGLPNRRSFRERIGEVLERRSREPDLRFAVGILDLDGFKEVNDRMGHPAGDELLVLVSRRLEGIIRSTDTLSRLGGDEFGLLLIGLDHEDVTFDRIVKTLSEPFEIGGERVEISGSLGVTFSPPDKGDVDPLLSHADLALYRVKSRGRNGWAPFHTDMEEALETRHRILSELDRALVEKTLVLHYQPQVDMVSGAVAGVEALVRWNHAERGLLPPDSFIPSWKEVP